MVEQPLNVLLERRSCDRRLVGDDELDIEVERAVCMARQEVRDRVGVVDATGERGRRIVVDSDDKRSTRHFLFLPSVMQRSMAAPTFGQVQGHVLPRLNPVGRAVELSAPLTYMPTTGT